MGYTHTNSKGKTYYLNSKDVTLKGGRNQTIYYFSKDANLNSKDVTLKGGRNQTIYYFSKDARAQACDLPAGKQVVESPKTGLPFVKSK